MKTITKSILSLFVAMVAFGFANAQTVTLDFHFDESNDWGSGYEQHTWEFTDATVVFTKANKQASDQPINDIPVTKGQPVTITLKDASKQITAVTFTARQWTTKTQTITLLAANDGITFSPLDGATSDNFILTYSEFPAGTNALQFTFSSSSNQIGIESCQLTLAEKETPAVSSPIFNILGGLFADAQTIELTCTTEDASIYYTLDGSTPSAGSTLYTGAIHIESTTTIKAIAIKDANTSSIVAATYTILTGTPATIAEFNAAEESDNIYYELTGTISNIENTTYGNFNLTDATGTVYVYGLTATPVSSNDKSFSSLGLKEGDNITIRGTRDSYNSEIQVGGPAFFISKNETPSAIQDNKVSSIRFDGQTIYNPENANIVVYSLVGTVVAEGNTDIDMSNQNSGIYIVRAGKSATKIVKQ